MPTPSHLELSFARWLRQNPDIPEPVRELQFFATRRWRFDFAWPEQMVAVEIDGLVRAGDARHQTYQGALGDAEKYECAMREGWRVYRVPGPWVRQGERDIWRPRVIHTLRLLLRLAWKETTE